MQMAIARRLESVRTDQVVDFDFFNPPGGHDDVQRAWASLHQGRRLRGRPIMAGTGSRRKRGHRRDSAIAIEEAVR